MASLRNRQVGIVEPHVGFEISLSNAAADGVGQIGLQAFAGCDEVLVVFCGDDDDQSGARVFESHAIFIAHILCHAECVGVFDVSDDDEYCLHIQFMVEQVEVIVGRVSIFLGKYAVRVADVLSGVREIYQGDIVSAPHRISVVRPFCGGSEGKKATGEQYQQHQ